jgi:hypothetical protein
MRHEARRRTPKRRRSAWPDRPFPAA